MQVPQRELSVDLELAPHLGVAVEQRDPEVEPREGHATRVRGATDTEQTMLSPTEADDSASLRGPIHLAVVAADEAPSRD
jgi:hypothetical protein